MGSMIVIKKEYSLSSQCIDAVAEEITRACASFSVDRLTALRFRLSIEESLNMWLKEIGAGAPVSLTIGKRIRPYFEVAVTGASCNPYMVSSESDEFGSGAKSILTGLNMFPAYSYRKNRNTLRFTVKRKQMNPILMLLLIVFSALAFGMAGKLLLPAQLLTHVNDSILTPLSDTVFRVLSCIAGPMVFLSVAWGIYGIGDVYTLGSIGKKLMGYFLLVVLCAALIGSVFYPLLGPALSVGSAQTSQAGKIFAILLDIFPQNIFSPFIEGNTLQIIFLAVVIGISMIFLGQRTNAVALAVEQINYIIQFLMSSISLLVPYFVFIVLVQMIWSGRLAVFSTVGRFSFTYLGAYLVFLVLLLLFVSVRNRRNPLELLGICLPSYLIGITTASSAATFEKNVSICKSKFGISPSLTSFGVPFGMVMFKPCTAIYYLLLCFYFSSVYAVQVSVSWIAVAVLISAISAVATPPIPGGAAAAYTILFLQLGIPTDALALALAIDMIFDFILTSGDMFSLLLELFHVSGATGMRTDTGNPITQ